jgi:hypothetical protein
MDIIHEILSEEADECSSSLLSDEEELSGDEWMAQTQMEEINRAKVGLETCQEQYTPDQVAPIRQPSNAPRAVRRVRGGAASAALMERLTVGMYFAVWYALNIVYNSKFLECSVGWFYMCSYL